MLQRNERREGGGGSQEKQETQRVVKEKFLRGWQSKKSKKDTRHFRPRGTSIKTGKGIRGGGDVSSCQAAHKQKNRRSKTKKTRKKMPLSVRSNDVWKEVTLSGGSKIKGLCDRGRIENHLKKE